jgi:hypothetical protein
MTRNNSNTRDILPENRICSTCRIKKPLTTEFFKKSKKDSKYIKNTLYRICKECDSKYNKIKYIENKNVIENDLNLKAKYINKVYKNQDKLRNREYSLDQEWIKENILEKNCVYCNDNCNGGIDRIDNSKGHTKDNCVPCCILCNSTKSNRFTYKEFKEIGKVILKIKNQRKNETNKN